MLVNTTYKLRVMFFKGKQKVNNMTGKVEKEITVQACSSTNASDLKVSGAFILQPWWTKQSQARRPEPGDGERETRVIIF